MEISEVKQGLTCDGPCHPPRPTPPSPLITSIGSLSSEARLDSTELAGGFDFGGERIRVPKKDRSGWV